MQGSRWVRARRETGFLSGNLGVENWNVNLVCGGLPRLPTTLTVRELGIQATVPAAARMTPGAGHRPGVQGTQPTPGRPSL